MAAITEYDLFFLSYDEPNAEKHWADLVAKAPWAERVHGVLGFDAVHREAASRSNTDWFVTIDADNIVEASFFDVQIDPAQGVTYSWNAVNGLNGLIYGNGGIKLWSRSFALNMNCHERAQDATRAVDFCWLPNYRHVQGSYSEVWPNGSPFQAWRAGFREGVKLALDRGERVRPRDMKARLHPQNLRNLRVWCAVGLDQPNGVWAIRGAREGWAAMCDPDWDHTVVHDFGWFAARWGNSHGGRAEDAPDTMDSIQRLGAIIEARTGIAVPLLHEDGQSEFFREAMRLRNG